MANKPNRKRLVIAIIVIALLGISLFAGFSPVSASSNWESVKLCGHESVYPSNEWCDSWKDEFTIDVQKTGRLKLTLSGIQINNNVGSETVDVYINSELKGTLSAGQTRSFEFDVNVGDQVKVVVNHYDYPQGSMVVRANWDVEVPPTVTPSPTPSPTPEVNQPPICNVVVDEPVGIAPHTATFDGTGSTDPEGDELTYLWALANNDVVPNQPIVKTTFTETGVWTNSLTVVDSEGLTDTCSVQVTVDKVPEKPGKKMCRGHVKINFLYTGVGSPEGYITISGQGLNDPVPQWDIEGSLIGAIDLPWREFSLRYEEGEDQAVWGEAVHHALDGTQTKLIPLNYAPSDQPGKFFALICGEKHSFEAAWPEVLAQQASRPTVETNPAILTTASVLGLEVGVVSEAVVAEVEAIEVLTEVPAPYGTPKVAVIRNGGICIDNTLGEELWCTGIEADNLVSWDNDWVIIYNDHLATDQFGSFQLPYEMLAGKSLDTIAQVPAQPELVPGVVTDNGDGTCSYRVQVEDSFWGISMLGNYDLDLFAQATGVQIDGDGNAMLSVGQVLTWSCGN